MVVNTNILVENYIQTNVLNYKLKSNKSHERRHKVQKNICFFSLANKGKRNEKRRRAKKIMNNYNNHITSVNHAPLDQKKSNWIDRK